jgi:hypothetical protein
MHSWTKDGNKFSASWEYDAVVISDNINGLRYNLISSQLATYECSNNLIKY